MIDEGRITAAEIHAWAVELGRTGWRKRALIEKLEAAAGLFGEEFVIGSIASASITRSSS